MTAEEQLRRAEKARQILNDPLVKEVLDMMEREIAEMWVSTPARDNEGREWLWRQAAATRKFRDILRGTMESGKLAVEEISRKQSLLERAKDLAKGRVIPWQA